MRTPNKEMERHVTVVWFYLLKDHGIIREKWSLLGVILFNITRD